MLPCSHSQPEEPSRGELFLPRKSTSKSSLTKRRAHHSPLLKGKGSLLPPVKLIPSQHGSPDHHMATYAQLMLLFPGLSCTCLDLQLTHLWTHTSLLLITYNTPSKSSPPAGFPGHSSEPVQPWSPSFLSNVVVTSVSVLTSPVQNSCLSEH